MEFHLMKLLVLLLDARQETVYDQRHWFDFCQWKRENWTRASGNVKVVSDTLNVIEKIFRKQDMIASRNYNIVENSLYKSIVT